MPKPSKPSFLLRLLIDAAAGGVLAFLLGLVGDIAVHPALAPVLGFAGDFALQLVLSWFETRRSGKRKPRLTLFRNAEREKSLLRLCKRGSPEDIRRALAEGAYPNAATGRGESALHIAAEHNPDPEVIRTLVQAGANVYARNDDGLTPLMLAAGRFVEGRDNPAVIPALLEAGAEVDARRGNGSTTLMAILYRWKPDPALVMTLLQAGADVHARDNEGHDVLWHARALRHGLPDEILRLLRAAGREDTDKLA